MSTNNEQKLSSLQVGKSGLYISDFTLGCMSFGGSKEGLHPWALDYDTSEKILLHAYEQGIYSFDTANVYSQGASEEFVGKIIQQHLQRDELILSTKLCGPMKDHPLSGGLSRRAIFHEIDASLRRLNTDYIDLYIIHRWDNSTPIEETLSALNDLVHMGKIRYIGASSMHAWQFAKACYTAKHEGWTNFISMQNHYNLLAREEEPELIPLCRELSVSLMPWSPLARGKLARTPEQDQNTERQKTDKIQDWLYNRSAGYESDIRERVKILAEKYNTKLAAVSLAWLKSKSPVVSPVIGATKIQHIDDAVLSREISLTQEDREFLEEPYPIYSPPEYS